MKENSENIFLEEELNKSIEILKIKSKTNKNKATLLNAISLSLGASITLMLGFEVSTEHVQVQKNVALSLSSILTIATGWNAFFDYKKLWIRQKSTLLSLYQIQNELRYRKSKNRLNDTDELFERYLNVWEKDSNEWRSIIQHASKPDKHSSDKK